MIVMLIVLIIMGLSISSIVYLNKKEIDCYDVPIFYFSLICASIVSIILTIVFGIAVIIEQSSYRRKEIEIEYTERYNTIMMAAEQGTNLMLLTSEISDYNKEILKARNNLDSPWINWFTNDIYNELSLIDLKELED